MWDRNKWRAEWRQRRKANVFERYGGAVCACCGEDELIFLTLNHLDGGGTQHRRQLPPNGQATYEWASKNDFPPIFNVLCFNCNFATANGRACPHQGVEA